MEIGANEVPSDNPNGYCRLCFSERNLVALCPDGAEPQKLLLDLIFETTGIEINGSDNSPGCICWRCAVTLEDFQLFRQRSLAHDAIVQRKFATNELETKSAKENVVWIPVESSITSLSNNQRKAEDDDDLKPEGNDNNNDQTKRTEKTKTFRCHVPGCNKQFISEQSLLVHYREQHADRCRPFQCNICKEKFKRKTHLAEHLATHSGENRYTCKDCGSTYAQPRSLLYHRKRAHSYKSTKTRQNSNPKDNQFKCGFCPKTFKHRPSLNFHAKSHYGQLPYVCEVCDARFANKQGKSVHKGRFHPDMMDKDILATARRARRRKQRKSLVPLDMDESEDVPSEEQQFQPGGDAELTNQSNEDFLPVTVKFEVEDNDL